MADNESIGGIAVDIVGNYAPLASDLDQAASLAAQAGEHIAEGMNAAAAQTDLFGGAITAAAVGMGSFEQQIQALVDSGSTLAEALAQVQSGATEVTAGVEEAGAAAAMAAEQMGLFDEAVQVPYADAAGQMNLFATELEPIVGAAAAAAAATGEFGDSAAKAAEEADRNRAALQELLGATEQTTEAEHHAAEGLSEWHEKLIAFGEALAITEGLREFGQEALAASDNITRASISLTALQGSGEKAAKTIEDIEALGIKDGLSLPGLLQASTRMTSLLGVAAPVPELLAKIADGAAVMGKDIGSAADAFDRLATMGTAGARQLMALGLSLDQLAVAMNKVTGEGDATAANVAKMFKALDQSERIEVLSAALDRLGGIAQETAEKTFGGQWQILANQWEQIMRDVGEALMPVITGLTNLMKVEILPFIKEVADGFNALPGPLKDTVVVIGLLTAAIVPITLAIGGLGFAVDAALAAMAPLVALVGGPLLAILGLGLVTALAAAAAGFTDLDAAMAKSRKTYEDTDAAFQKMLTSDVAYIAASQSASFVLGAVAAEEDKIKAALDAGAISKQLAVTLLNQLADAAKKATAIQFKAWSDELGVSVKVVTESLTPAAAAAEGLRVKMQALGEAVTKTKDDLVKTTTAYNEHKATAQEVAKAYDAWQGATNTLKSAQQALLPIVTNVHHATHDFVNDLTEYPSAAAAAAATTDAVAIRMNQASLAVADAQKNLVAVIKAYDDHNATAQQVTHALDLVNAAWKTYNDLLWKTPPAYQATTIAAKDVWIALSQLDTNLPPLASHTLTLADDMKGLGITLDGVGGKTAGLIEWFDNLHLHSDVTLEAAEAGWARISAAVNKLAKTDLPAALAQYDAYRQLLVQTGASEGQLLDVEKQRLQKIVDIATQSGTSATAQIVAIERVKLQQQVLYDQTHLLGDLYVGVINDLLKGWESLGKSVADNIIDEKNWHDVWINGIKAIGKSILETLVGGAFKALEDSILKSTGLMDNLTGAITKLFGSQASGAAGSAAGAASNAAGKAAGAASSTAGAGIDGVLGIAGNIGSIASAVTGIIGIFQGADLYHAMKAVALNTLGTANEVTNLRADSWARQDGLLAKLDDIWNEIRTVESVIHDAAQGIVDAIGGVPRMADGGAIVGDGLRYLHDGEVVIPRAEVPAVLGIGSMTSPANYSTASNVNAPMTFNIYESANPRETARQLANTLKTLSSKFSPYGN